MPSSQGSDRTIDSNASPSGTTPAALSSAGSDSSVDCGYYKMVTIGDFVWTYTNRNDLHSFPTRRSSDLTLTLTGTTGAGVAVTDHATTSASGAYQFTAAPGTYTVTVEVGRVQG